MDLFTDVQKARDRIASYIIQTPLEHSPWLSRETGAEVYLKLEHLQTTGSFKLRGAANRLLSLLPEERERGVITASTGNHGAAVAYMADQLGVKATIYLPDNASSTKLDQLKLYAVELVAYGQDSVEAEAEARRVAEAEGRTFISPYNDPYVMAGQGTLGAEVLDQLPDVQQILVPVGGGGLIGGIAGYLQDLAPQVQVVGCQPRNSAVMYQSVQAGKVLDLPSSPTLSDGTAGGLEADSITFPVCQEAVNHWALISEAEIRAGLRFLLEKHYLLVEGAAALSVAALRQEKARYQGQKVVLILCGRKLGLETLQSLLAEVNA